MTSGQWYGIRQRLRNSVPNTVDVDWLMAALGTSEKGAKNVMPQLRAAGLIDGANKPNGDLVHDLRDDSTYADACRRVLDKVYPSTLLEAWNDPNEDPVKVAAWFMRNAGTGAVTAKMQARLYLLLLKGELPSSEETAKKATAKKITPAPPRKKAAKTPTAKVAEKVAKEEAPPQPQNLGPNLHIDMQIHISADASDTQIDTIFKSMAKHLYGRE